MKILLIEDDTILKETIADFLQRKGNEVTAIEDGAEAIDVIGLTPFDLYIIDINIPHINGFEIVKHIRQNDLQTPIIIITASMELEHFKSAYDIGCDDYIRKPFHLEELSIIIDKVMSRKIEITIIEQQNIRLEKMANCDPLTQIRNRRSISELLELEIERAKRYQHPLSLIYMDIDHFKAVNDNYGHKVGDEVLTTFVEIVSQQLRSIDLLGRWGGEEFLLILPETNLTDATHTAERVRVAIEQHPFNGTEGITTSSGVVEYIIDEAIDEFIHRADKLLYKAKANGRNTIIFL